MRARFKSFLFAWNGVKTLFKSEMNAKIHLTLSILAVIVGFTLNIDRDEWILLSLTITLVFFAEAINTVVERISDEISTDFNIKIKEIKDISAGAVLIVSIFSLIVGYFLFAQKLFNLIF